MDLFDFFRDWDLDQPCHFEQDRSALKRKEWERRTQEVQQDEDLFATGFNLFGEPYKTNRGDALANRVQNTLGNYDEMKDLLTNHSNQSHLVGIPKNSVPQTPVEKNEQNFFPEQRNRVAQCHQSSSHPASNMPPPSTIASNSSLMHNHEATRKTRMDWPQGGHTSTCTQANPSSSLPTRSKHNSSHDLSQIRYEDLYNCQNDQHKLGIIDEPVPTTSSSNTRRHNHSKSVSAEQSYKESLHSKSPIELEFSIHGSVSPLPSTSLLLANNGLASQNFPPGIHSKTSTIQQKPTAYVRPMDGQDQISNDSPELKPPTETEDGFNNQQFGIMLEAKVNVPVAKNKLPKLTLPQANEVSLPNDASCVEEILREMTHSWPPPLTAIHTPCKSEQTKFSIPTKDSQHFTSGYGMQKRCDVTSKTAAKSIPQKSMLEDDLKLSSDEDDNEQANEKTKPRNIPVNGLPMPPTNGANTMNSSGISGSSSESESSSESDSDSESSSSDSECNEQARHPTPEPDPPSTNKWQLDKWLNKVNSHNKTIIINQNDVHSDNISESQNNQQAEHEKIKSDVASTVPQPDPKERELRSPVKEKAKPKVPPKNTETKTIKQKSPAHNEPVSQRSIAKKQPKKVERTSSAEDYNWNKPNPTTSTPKDKEVRETPEQPKSRAKNTVAKTAPRKEQRTSTGGASDKKKARGANKIVPKSREFIETDSASDSNTDQEDVLQVKISSACSGPSNPTKTKDCSSSSSNVLSVSSSTSHNSSISLDQTNNDLEEQFSPLPVVQNELLSPLRDYEELKSLWVKIDLTLLSRIPGQEAFDNVTVQNEVRESAFKHKHQTPATPVEKNPTKSRRKHKPESFDTQSNNKKQRLEEDTTPCAPPPCISPIPNSRITSSKEVKKTTKKREEKVFPPLLSPLADEPPCRRHSSDNISFGLDSSATPFGFKTTNTSTRHKKNGNAKGIIEDDHSRPPSTSLENIHLEPEEWCSVPILANGNTEYRRSKITFDETLHNADYYMQEAKRLKHKADALIEKFGKAVNYADAALSFIECGNAMERDPLEAKSPYTMYSETVELIRYAMRLKNFTGSAASEGEKKLAVLCYRCLSLLYLRMFKLKKDHAMKYSRSLMEYFKNSSKSSQAPSPWGGNGKNTETPSPMSLSPSSINSAGNSSGTTGSSSTGTISIPQRIHQMAASHVNITNNVLRSYEHWDMADKLTRESKEFFQDLDTMMEPLTQHSTMTNLVRYVRQGLHWLRIESQLL
ncbi:AF4/FMR2 family member 2 isoform X2 [Spea bombifrons]|uniref:AF4/FMR2 family member 2 isoform X2 n=1 Tax=Spea bombifrons TaxID=233779 RepID=UPI00234B5836|nr:AF4/FMR2 family member 2 isoform X2 [Spea bombifrons]